MVRVKRGFVARHRRKKLLNRAKGFTGSLSKLFRPAKQAVMHALSYATSDRRTNKGNFRRLWIARINAAVKELGLSYNKFMNSLKNKKILINRKMLSEIAINDPKTFQKIVEFAKK